MELNAVGRGAPPRRLRAAVHAGDEAGHKLLQAAGYTAVRSGYRMEIGRASCRERVYDDV